METLVLRGLCRGSLRVFACLGLIAFVGCGDDDGKGQITGPQGAADGGIGTINLTGVWVTTDFECRNAKRRETVQIDVFETTITATKVDGDECVPSGYVAFEGKLPKPTVTTADLPVMFSFKLYEVAAGDPASSRIVDSGTGRLTTPNSMVLALATTQLRFNRSSAADGGGVAGAGSPTGTGGAGGSSMNAARGGSGGMSGGRGLRPDDGGTGGSAGDRASAGRDSAGGGGSSEGEAGAGAGGTGGGGGRAGSDAPAAGSGGASGRGESGAGGAGGAGGAAAECEGPILPGATCDHVAQCGCEAGENCRFDDANPPSCFPAGTGANGELCKDHSDCGARLLCVGDLCRPMCRTDADCEGTCDDVTVESEDVEGLKVCAEPCEPVLPAMCFRSPPPTTGACNPCEAGATCTPSDDSAVCVAGALMVLRAPGEPCTADDECYGGGCLEEVCRTWCRDSTDCSEIGDACQKGSGYYVTAGVEVGLCVPEI